MKNRPDAYCPGCGSMGNDPCPKTCDRDKERRYTMPQGFMDDSSVPVRWRLYGLINGFWIGGKTVYASNEWFSKELECSERQISRALEELEDEGLLTRNITGFSRIILPGGLTPDVRGGRRRMSAEGDAGRQHTSDSIADNIHSSEVGTSLGYEIVSEDEKPPKEKKDTTYRKVYELWGTHYPLNWRTNTTEKEAAKNILEEHGIDKARNALEFYRSQKGAEKLPQILKPSDLDRKWVNLQAFKERI